MDDKSINKPIRILNVVPNMRAAGIETFIMNVYRNIDRTKIQFDFIVHNMEKKQYDDEIEKMGGKIYRFTFKDDKNLFKYIKDLNNFFLEHREYKIVHGHMQSMMPLYLLIAKINKVPIRIAHSHNNNYEKTIKGFILHIFSKFSKFVSTNNFACSDEAGKYLFANKRFDIIYNGINIEKFKYDLKIRENIRAQLQINDCFVIGHVGRFELQKNHKFLIKIITKLSKSKDKKIKLLLVGEGKTQKSIKKLVEKNKLADNVIFLGVRKDISEIMQGLDVFLLPSLYEGLGIVAIESQASGLHTIVSNNIAKETNISDKIEYLPINNVELWVEKINNYPSNYDRLSEYEKILNSKFNIFNVANFLQEEYINLWRSQIEN